MATPWQVSFNSDAVISHSSLCLIGNPPLGQHVALKTNGHRHSLRGSAMGASHTKEIDRWSSIINEVHLHYKSTA